MPDEEKGLVLGGPMPLEQPKTQDPATFLNPMPGVPTMAAPPAGAFARPQGRPLAGMENKYPLKAINPTPRSVQWSGGEINRLYTEAKAGKSPTELQEIFPTRSLKSIQRQIENLFGGVRRVRGLPPSLGGPIPGKGRYPPLKDDEFSQIHPTIREWITSPGEIQVAGDVVGFPKTLQEQDANRLKGKEPTTQGGAIVPSPSFGFDPLGDMTGGGKVLPGPGYTSKLETDEEVG